MSNHVQWVNHQTKALNGPFSIVMSILPVLHFETPSPSSKGPGSAAAQFHRAPRLAVPPCPLAPDLQILGFWDWMIYPLEMVFKPWYTISNEGYQSRFHMVKHSKPPKIQTSKPSWTVNFHILSIQTIPNPSSFRRSEFQFVCSPGCTMMHYGQTVRCTTLLNYQDSSETEA